MSRAGQPDRAARSCRIEVAGSVRVATSRVGSDGATRRGKGPSLARDPEARNVRAGAIGLLSIWTAGIQPLFHNQQ